MDKLTKHQLVVAGAISDEDTSPDVIDADDPEGLFEPDLDVE